MRSFLKITALLGATSFAVSALHAQEPVLLRWTPEVGQTEVRKTEISVSVAGAGVPMAGVFMTQKMYSTDEVLAADGETSRIRSVIDSMEMDMPMMGGTPPGMPSLDGMTVQFSVTSLGVVADIDVEEGTAPLGGDMFASQMNEGLESLYTQFPEEAVGPGDVWNVTVQLPAAAASILPPEARTIEFTFRLESVNASDGIATISVQGVIGSGRSSGTVSGQLEFDFRRSSMRSAVQKMEMTVPAPTGGMMETTVESKMTLVSSSNK